MSITNKVKGYLRHADELYSQIKNISSELKEAESIASSLDAPVNLCPATASDVVPGSVFWYPENSGQKWILVESVRDSDDKEKAFRSQGALFGLRGAYVEVAE